MANKQEKNNENKICFLSNAISDISSYIQLADTKVSIIVAAVVAIVVGIISCHDLVQSQVSKIVPCTWFGIILILLFTLGVLSIVGVFLFGILTIKGHKCVIGYNSKWFISKSISEYSFDKYYKDIQKMDDDDIIKNMSAELYKLNAINRQKMSTFKWTIRSFAFLLISILVITFLLFAI